MYALGFGFDSLTDDLKVVRIAYVLNDTGHYSVPPVVHVYTVNGGAWRALNSSSLSPMHCVVDLSGRKHLLMGLCIGLPTIRLGVMEGE